MKTTKQIILFGLSFILTFAVSEVFIRTSNLASVSSTEFYDDIGRGRRKNLNFLRFNEGFGIGKFNQYGYIGEPHSQVKTNNTIRIILMGDSYVEAFQIFRRDYFGEIAKKYLKQQYPKNKIEILNFGRSGFDIADIYAYQKSYAEKFNPDFILYMISNDDLVPKYSDPLRPKTIIKNDSLKISFHFDPQEIEIFEKTKFITQNFAIFNMLNNGRKRAKTTPVLSILTDKVYFWFNSEIPSDPKINNQEKDYQINLVTSKIIKSLDTSKVVIINRGILKLPAEFKKLCTINGLKYLDLSSKLNLMKDQGEDPYEWKITKKEGHWNQNAHKVVGKEIAEMLNSLIDNKNK